MLRKLCQCLLSQLLKNDNTDSYFSLFLAAPLWYYDIETLCQLDSSHRQNHEHGLILGQDYMLHCHQVFNCYATGSHVRCASSQFPPRCSTVFKCVAMLKSKGKFLYSAASSPKHFTLYFPGRPVQSDTISPSLRSIQPYAIINMCRLGCSYTNPPPSIEPGSSKSRVQSSTSEPLRSTVDGSKMLVLQQCILASLEN